MRRGRRSAPHVVRGTKNANIVKKADEGGRRKRIVAEVLPARPEDSPEDDVASGYDDRPDYRVEVLARRNLVTAWLGERMIASSSRPLVVDEQDHGIVIYFPRKDIGVALSLDPHTSSMCPYKGRASYWRFDGDGGTPLCWSYRTPSVEVARLAGHVAFFQDRVSVRIGVATPAVIGR